MSLLALQVFERVHFYGLNGWIGFLVALVVFIIGCGIAFKIISLVLPKVVQDGTWQQVIYWLLVLIAFLIFLAVVGII